MSKGELRKNMPVETVSGAANPSNARTTHLEAFGTFIGGNSSLAGTWTG